MAESTKMLGKLVIESAVITDAEKNITSLVTFGEKIKEYLPQNTTDLLSIILCGATALESSDVHIEPQENMIRFRIRVDGILQEVISFESETYHNLLTRIKLLSKIKLNIEEKPQDGRFTVLMKEALIEIRTSSLPSEWGESIVLRILNPKNLMELSSLGLRKDLYEIVVKELGKPNGMIAVGGPTGSGKTTTLYAFLTKIQNPGIKIITIEDPIEYHLGGISQTQVDPEKGYSFFEGLASIVRQDPDIILVGEIRDSKTAKISLQAALTGHLVLTTIHTNDAAGAIPRLLDLEASLSSIASALNMIVGERLIRKVCKKCVVLSPPSKEELADFNERFKNLPSNVEIPKDIAKVEIPKASEKGCVACNFTGYKGRKGIFEAFVINDEMEEFILTNPPMSVIKKMAIKNGMVTMYQAGLIEVVLGETTLEEIRRVIEEEE